ncbi:hypothetical protein [Enterobacter kobei]|uniref:hypothetical protein n=1 Tax=Enterobacter kobei TaxID=208224 RepID=UPI0032AF4E79
MNSSNLKMVIAGLLEDARRIQTLEPNAGTAARIEEAEFILREEKDAATGIAKALVMHIKACDSHEHK